MAPRSASQSEPNNAPRYYARRGGFDYAGRPVDRGLVLQLVGALNDEKLVRLGYFAPLEAKAETYQCAACGAEFIGISERTAHGDARHRVRDLTPDEEDAREDRRERIENDMAPLYLDKTKAAQAAT
jgi:hypothetical protein